MLSTGLSLAGHYSVRVVPPSFVPGTCSGCAHATTAALVGAMPVLRPASAPNVVTTCCTALRIVSVFHRDASWVKVSLVNVMASVYALKAAHNVVAIQHPFRLTEQARKWMCKRAPLLDVMPGVRECACSANYACGTLP